MTGLTSKELLEATIRGFCCVQTCANLPEFEFPTDEEGKFTRRIDLLSIFTGGQSRGWTAAATERGGNTPSGYRVGFELKVARGDLARDIKDKYKHRPVAQIVNEFYFVVAEGLLDEDDYWKLPWKSGVIEVHKDKRTRWLGVPRATLKKKAGVNYTPETPMSFVNEMAARTLYGGASSGIAPLKWPRNALFVGAPT